MSNASLVLVGSGIKFISHLTPEARGYIEKSDKVLYLVNEPAMQEWIRRKNPNTESLDPFYFSHPLRADSYKAITVHILKALSENKNVCVVLYGHPTVFAQPALDAVRQAKQEGYDTRILPGISAEDCLLADLMINPGDCGMQSFEATDFLVYRRQFNPYSHLLLWQIGIIGITAHSKSKNNSTGTKVLILYLNSTYPLTHPVILYEAAQYPSYEPTIVRLTLKELTGAEISSIATLYSN